MEKANLEFTEESGIGGKAIAVVKAWGKSNATNVGTEIFCGWGSNSDARNDFVSLVPSRSDFYLVAEHEIIES